MSWAFLMLAGCIEVLGVIMMKAYAVTAKKLYLLGVAFFFVLSLGSLSLALREIPMGMGYAIWTGIGTAGGVLVGIIFYKESRNFWKLFFITLIVACSVGLKLVS
ncbi:DMT family transporter [Helicobacter winghamensis]|uniref:DMT family transporter n=1 Tax=Helicobacter winghamensis TaxID=157268 RepID=UPI00279E1C88